MSKKIEQLDVPLNRDVFLRELLRELAGTLEEVVGFEEAAGFISIVGQHIGDWINADYRAALGAEQLSREQVAEVLVDLKRRIQGDFHLISADADKLVLGNRACPFGDKVKDRNSLCMMTSNVFGTVAAENLAYAKVALHQTIARGDAACRIVVHLRDGQEAEQDQGIEYFGS
ncbi:transcriptional regulator [Ectothiorhodospiraceae bacterium 2226]|nr:transcriptional regulator [Ectothiorhodospiraceae bacterium 2226]